MCRAAGFTPYGPAQPEELQLTGLPLGLWGHWWSLANDKGAGLRRSYARSRGLQVRTQGEAGVGRTRATRGGGGHWPCCKCLV